MSVHGEQREVRVFFSPDSDGEEMYEIQEEGDDEEEKKELTRETY